ncbi:hypothetical protein K466DRAFT_171149 [Polyporus arcularius HHB13444]|uniref:Uncharacterized protein n=1 Tax=Polyporus arcularius HHB13444 TaxID=1314778 RepID=A0A5C3P8C9_9APHY|nr:hypothetical protein K466DRAFT_171149 [Polyporus arcularius HHB13444]
MTSRHRTTSSSRKDSYGQWRPSDSDSDRPRQTMATTQRHNVDQIVAAEAPRKHRSSRRTETVDALDPSTSYSSHHHKSSSRHRSSSAQQASYYAVPPSPNPSQHQTQDAYYDLRAHLGLKRKTDRRSPRSREKALVGDEAKPSRSGHRSSRQAYTITPQHDQSIAQPQSSHFQPIVPPQPDAVPAQATRDPTSSSRHHRDREKDREKASSRDPDKVKLRDSAEKSEERERRKRREKDAEKERPPKDKERHREKDRHRDREARAAVETRPVDAASVYHAYAQTAATAQRSADRIPAPYTDYALPVQPQSSAYPLPTSSNASPWAGLTSAGRGAAAPAPEPTYPYVSDKEDPPLPIPPPGRRRERTSSKPHRSHHHKVSSQQAGQDSGLSSSEQEQHSVLERVSLMWHTVIISNMTLL